MIVYIYFLYFFLLSWLVSITETWIWHVTRSSYIIENQNDTVHSETKEAFWIIPSISLYLTFMCAQNISTDTHKFLNKDTSQLLISKYFEHKDQST
jgi:hypothetical protein